jgi:hypothetical protein
MGPPEERCAFGTKHCVISGITSLSLCSLTALCLKQKSNNGITMLAPELCSLLTAVCLAQPSTNQNIPNSGSSAWHQQHQLSEKPGVVSIREGSLILTTPGENYLKPTRALASTIKMVQCCCSAAAVLLATPLSQICCWDQRYSSHMGAAHGRAFGTKHCVISGITSQTGSTTVHALPKAARLQSLTYLHNCTPIENSEQACTHPRNHCCTSSTSSTSDSPTQNPHTGPTAGNIYQHTSNYEHWTGKHTCPTHKYPLQNEIQTHNCPHLPASV